MTKYKNHNRKKQLFKKNLLFGYLKRNINKKLIKKKKNKSIFVCNFELKKFNAYLKRLVWVVMILSRVYTEVY